MSRIEALKSKFDKYPLEMSMTIGTIAASAFTSVFVVRYFNERADIIARGEEAKEAIRNLCR